MTTLSNETNCIRVSMACGKPLKFCSTTLRKTGSPLSGSAKAFLVITSIATIANKYNITAMSPIVYTIVRAETSKPCTSIQRSRNSAISRTERASRRRRSSLNMYRDSTSCTSPTIGKIIQKLRTPIPTKSRSNLTQLSPKHSPEVAITRTINSNTYIVKKMCSIMVNAEISAPLKSRDCSAPMAIALPKMTTPMHASNQGDTMTLEAKCLGRDTMLSIDPSESLLSILPTYDEAHETSPEACLVVEAFDVYLSKSTPGAPSVEPCGKAR
mmetsp:Transcript_92334/g.258003  ORF Transcript_92334/g.258003 Transcript_92334/m.258003 type:complete len:270 (+) Transcript_92334:27-836(+)